MANFLNYNRHPATRYSPIIAAIDLGTNSCRLLIAKVQGHNFRIIDSFSRVVRLGEGVHDNEELSQEAIERTLEALQICKTKLNFNNVARIRAVTTEACRRATNSHELINRAQREIGINIEIITTAEEARLALTGCAGVLNSRIPYALAFDIGGGSTEIMWLRINEPRRIHRKRAPMIEVLDYISLPHGVVTLSEEHRGNITPETAYGIHKDIQNRLKAFSERNNIAEYMDRNRVQMIGTSGTVTTIAAIQMNLERYERRMIDGVFVELADIHRISEEILHMTPEERSAHNCIGIGRSDLVVMGTSILQGICYMWPVYKLRVADRGVREGILTDLVREMNPRTRPTLKSFCAGVSSDTETEEEFENDEENNTPTHTEDEA